MTFFRKKADPITARSKELGAQISALEEEIRRLSGSMVPESAGRKCKNERMGSPLPPATLVSARKREPAFEHLEFKRTKPDEALDSSAAHYNDLGVRKYDLLGAVRKARSIFSPEAAENPKLITYLAAGSVKGLRPLRYEKRIARNRFIFLSIVFVVILWGIAAAFLENR